MKVFEIKTAGDSSAEVMVGYIPDRKRPVLAKQEEGSLEILASFRSVEDAAWFTGWLTDVWRSRS